MPIGLAQSVNPTSIGGRAGTLVRSLAAERAAGLGIQSNVYFEQLVDHWKGWPVMATSGARRSAGGSASRSTATRRALLDAAVDALREVGFAGASAREIARRAGSTQSQVFYHYTSVVDLLLAALDEVSGRRLAHYQPLLEAAQTPADLIGALKTVIESDLASGDLRVLAEMIAGAAVVPGLDEQVRHRLGPWFDFAEAAVTKAVARTPFAAFVPVKDIAHAVVACVLGLEMLDSLGEHDRTAHLLSEGSKLVGILAAVQEGGLS